MARFNYQRVKAEVHDYCECAWFNTFDEPGIVAALRKMAYDNDCVIDSIDDVAPDIWDSIVEKYDTGCINTIA